MSITVTGTKDFLGKYNTSRQPSKKQLNTIEVLLQEKPFLKTKLPKVLTSANCYEFIKKYGHYSNKVKIKND